MVHRRFRLHRWRHSLLPVRPFLSQTKSRTDENMRENGNSITRRLMNVFAPLLQHQPLFKALSLAIREKELPLVILIRLCPFPFPYSNLLFASIESVSLVQFFLATLLITPKLILHVWIGSKLYVFADPNERAKMDPNTKWINGASIVASALLGAGTSIYLYRVSFSLDYSCSCRVGSRKKSQRSTAESRF